MMTFLNNFGVIIGILLGMGTIVMQMWRMLRKATAFYLFALSAEEKLTSIDQKISTHLEGHA